MTITTGMCSVWARDLSLPADLETVEARHHDVEQNDVDALARADIQGSLAGRGRYDLEVFRLEPGLQQPDIGENVVDNEDPGRHIKLSTPTKYLRRYASPMKRRTVSRNTATDIGFDT